MCKMPVYANMYVSIYIDRDNKNIQLKNSSNQKYLSIDIPEEHFYRESLEVCFFSSLQLLDLQTLSHTTYF